MLCVYRYPRRAEEHTGFPEAGVKGGCELISVCVANQASALGCWAASPDLMYTSGWFLLLLFWFFATISRTTNVNDKSPLQFTHGKAHFYS